MEQTAETTELEEITKRLEYIFLKKIISGLRDESIPVEMSRSMAQAFLAIEPFVSIEDAKMKMTQFVQTYPAHIALTDYMDAYHEEKKTDQIIADMREHMANNQIDKALQIAKG